MTSRHTNLQAAHSTLDQSLQVRVAHIMEVLRHEHTTLCLCNSGVTCGYLVLFS
jgi:hypothetical protein